MHFHSIIKSSSPGDDEEPPQSIGSRMRGWAAVWWVSRYDELQDSKRRIRYKISNDDDLAH